MIDLRNIDTFLTSIPKWPDEQWLDSMLHLQMRKPRNIRAATKTLAKRGYLGCVSFAHQNDKAHWVVRLLPGKPLSQCPIAYVWKRITEGLTIAPSLTHFVAGRLAQMDVASLDFKITETTEEKQRVLDFASLFGSNESCNRIFGAMNELSQVESMAKRMGLTSKEADPNDPVFESIYAAHCLHYDAIVPWLENLSPEVAAQQLTKRLQLTYHIYFKTGVDITELATELVLGDDVFDPHFTALSPKSGIDNWNIEPLVKAVKWLKEQSTLPPKGIPEPVWKAVTKFAQNPFSYTGKDHFKAAKAIQEQSPEIAYTLLVNGAAYYFRVNKKPPLKAIKLAYKLARKLEWDDLAEVLRWTLD